MEKLVYIIKDLIDNAQLRKRKLLKLIKKRGILIRHKILKGSLNVFI